MYAIFNKKKELKFISNSYPKYIKQGATHNFQGAISRTCSDGFRHILLLNIESLPPN